MKTRLVRLIAIVVLAAAACSPEAPVKQKQVGHADAYASIYPGRTTTVHVVRPMGVEGATKLTLKGLPKGVVSSMLFLEAAEDEGTITLSTLPEVRPADVSVAHLVEGDGLSGDAGFSKTTAVDGITVRVAIPEAGAPDETLRSSTVAFPPGTTVGFNAMLSATPDYGFVYAHEAYEGDFSSLASVMGPVPAGHDDMLVLAHHFLPDGTLDQSYGTNGYLVAAAAKVSYDDGHANAPYFQNRARFKLDGQQRLLVGVSGTGPVKYMGDLDAGRTEGPVDLARVIRYDKYGQPDNTFGVGGRIALGAWDELWQIEAYADGRILVATTLQPSFLPPVNGLKDFSGHLKRFLANGSVDLSFGNGGDVDVGMMTFHNLAFVLEANEAITVATESDRTVKLTEDPVVVSRFTRDGVLDTSFGTNGRVVLPVYVQVAISSAIFMARSTSGRLAVSVLEGFTGSALAVLTATGSLDTSFARTGILREAMGPDFIDETSGAVAFDASENVLQGTSRYTRTESFDYSLRRYSPVGTRTLDLHHEGIWSNFSVEPDGRLLMVGTVAPDGFEMPAFARFWP